MKKIMALSICVFLTMAITVMAKPAKDLYDGKTAGNSGFTNIVGDNFNEYDVEGWVKYSKDANCLYTTWIIEGLEPGKEYQLKLNSKCGDGSIKVCDNPNSGDIWECGDWGSEPFLVMDFVTANPQGKINHAIKECRLMSGDYQDMQFSVTENNSPWNGAWTWENIDDTEDPNCDADYGSDLSAFTIK